MHLRIWVYTLAACGSCIVMLWQWGQLALSAVCPTAQSAVVHAAAAVSRVASALLPRGMTRATAE